MPAPQQGDRWQTLQVECREGLITNEDLLSLGTNKPGAAIVLLNMEPSVTGGYQRMLGFAAYDSSAVPGTGNVLGVAVFNNGAIACRGVNVYRSAGVGWTIVNTSARTGAGRYRFERYNFVIADTICGVDGANPAFTWDGTTYTLINGTGAPTAPSAVCNYANCLFFAQGPILTFTAPNTDTDCDPAHGAGVINVGDDILQIKPWQGNLIVFGKRSIKMVTGTSAADFVMTNIARNVYTVSGDSVQEVAGDLLYLTPDGLRPISGTARIGDFELGNISHAVHDLVASMQGFPQYSSVAIKSKTQYRLYPFDPSVIATAQSSLLGAIRTYGEEKNPFYGSPSSWEFAQVVGYAPTCAASDFANGKELVLHGDATGMVYQEEFGNTFAGIPISWIYQTPYITFSDPLIRKVLQKLTVFLNTQGNSTFNVQALLDFQGGAVTGNIIQPPSITLGLSNTATAFFDISLFDVATFDGATTPITKTNLVGSCFTASFKFSGSDSNPPLGIRAMAIDFGIGGRR